MEVLHFDSQAERFKYLKGGFHEIKLIEVDPDKKPEPKTKKKGNKKNDRVQVE